MASKQYLYSTGLWINIKFVKLVELTFVVWTFCIVRTIIKGITLWISINVKYNKKICVLHITYLIHVQMFCKIQCTYVLTRYVMTF